MASRVMYSYSGNTNSNNSNVGATYRHDTARRWPPSYTRTTSPLRPTGSVTGGVQSGGTSTSKSFSSKSLLPSKISPGAVSSGKPSQTTPSTTSRKIFDHSPSTVEKWRNTTGSTVAASKSIASGNSSQLPRQSSLKPVTTRERSTSPLPRRRSTSITIGTSHLLSTLTPKSSTPTPARKTSAHKRSNSVSLPSPSSLLPGRKSPPPYRLPEVCTQGDWRHTQQFTSVQKTATGSQGIKTTTVSPSRTTVSVPQSPSRERRRKEKEEERKRKERDEEERKKREREEEERRRREREEEERRRRVKEDEKRRKEKTSRPLNLARPVTPSHTSRLSSPRLVRSSSTSSLSLRTSDGGWSTDASSQGSAGLSPTWKYSGSTVKDCMDWSQGNNIGRVTAAKTTPVSPVGYSGTSFSGGVRPVGQITVTSGEQPLSPSLVASTAARVSEQSTRQRSMYFSTAGTSFPSHSSSSSSPSSSPSSSVWGSKGGMVGLWNLGNTCFMNCMLQCLGHTPEMTELFLGRAKTTGLTGKYVDLMHQMWSPQTTQYHNVLHPRGLKDCISKIHPEFYGSNQHDAQELLRFLLAGLQNEWLVDEKKNRRVPQKMDSDVLGKLGIKEEGEIMWEQSLYLEDTPLARVFMGQLLSSLYCTSCKHTSRTFDPIWDLALPFPDHTTSKSVVDLLDCFRVFTREEVLDGADRALCSGCKKLQCCHKTLTVHRPPPILVIHLKRFYGLRFRRKLSAKVRIPLFLDIAEFLTHEIENELKQKGLTRYELYAIANHMGSESWGHYTTTYKHHTTHKWYNVSDDKVYPSPSYSHEGIMESENAYVLFYRCVKD